MKSGGTVFRPHQKSLTAAVQRRQFRDHLRQDLTWIDRFGRLPGIERQVGTAGTAGNKDSSRYDR
jgi:hypothetical protein